MKLVFMGTPDFSVPALKACISAHEVLAVYTQPDRPVGRGLKTIETPVKKVALENNIPVHQPEKLSHPGEYEKLQALKPDAIIVVAYGQILKKNILELPRLGCINIHSSLLPRWRGAAPIHHAILAGDTKTGITTMKMAEGLDTGDIYEQESVTISEHETVSQLHDRLSQIGGKLILTTLTGLNNGTLKGRPQQEDLVTIAHKLTKEMEFLDVRQPAIVLDRQVRALNPWPGTSLSLKMGAQNERVKIKEAQVSTQSVPQGVVDWISGSLLLGTSKGSLKILKIQPEGKKEMDGASFINGLKGRGVIPPFQLP